MSQVKPNCLISFTRQEGVLVPHVVRCCVEEVERRGMDEVGIYRISGAANDIAELKTAFDISKETNVPLLKDPKDDHRGLSTGAGFFSIICEVDSCFYFVQQKKLRVNISTKTKSVYSVIC